MDKTGSTDVQCFFDEPVSNYGLIDEHLDDVDKMLDWIDLVGVSGGACRFTPWPAGTNTGDSKSEKG